MSFDSKFIEQFYQLAEKIAEKELDFNNDSFHIGDMAFSNILNPIVIKVIEAWVKKVDQLLELVLEINNGKVTNQYISLYKERGITYDEFYYLFSQHLNEEEYHKTPAYIFTHTYSQDHRAKKFAHLEYTPQSYVQWIMNLQLVPTSFFDRRLRAVFPPEALFSHSYCVAKTRSGKTELMKVVLDGLLKKEYKKTSIVVLDPHGEFAREIRRLKIVSKDLDSFVYIDPTIKTGYTPVFNPFDIKDKNEFSISYSVDSFLEAFEQLLIKQGITGSMTDLLRPCIHTLLYHDDMTMLDLLTMVQAIGTAKKKKNIESLSETEKRMFELGRSVPDEMVRNFFNGGWTHIDSRTIPAVVSRIGGILSHPLVRRFVIGKKSTINLEDYLNSGKLVVVNLDFTKLGNVGSEAIGRLIVSEIQNISARRNRITDKRKRPKTVVFIDECQRFVSASIEKALSEFSKFNTSLFLAHQYIDQIDDGMIKAMLSNTENKIVGRNSSATMKAVAPDMGNEVDANDLLEVKKYHFYIKAGDRTPFLFKTSSILLDKPESPYYITEEEAKEKVDSYMLEKYYRVFEQDSIAETSPISSEETSEQNESDSNTPPFGLFID